MGTELIQSAASNDKPCAVREKMRISLFLLHQLMSSTRLQPHHSLPAPVVHATFSTQSKSHVLAGVQDAYWSDDEAVWSLILFSR